MTYYVWHTAIDGWVFLVCWLDLEMAYGPRAHAVTYHSLATTHTGCVMVCGN